MRVETDREAFCRMVEAHQAALERGDLAALNPYARCPAPHGELIASTACAYGLDEQESADSYLCYEDYDITERPLWKFVFYPESFEGMSAVPVYEVELDAYTGGTAVRMVR